jgi:MoxR-like ATPase
MATELSPQELQAEADQFRNEFQAVREAVGKVIVGQQRVVEATLTALFCGGNVLLEGVPGLGKTELVKALSQVLRLEFRRIQFTPDLMPADVIGTNIMTTDDAGKYRFEFRQGPIFTQLLLADEINRATPKTQSALLETMQEGTVTTGGTTYTLAPPFFVLATQNPIEQEGTYPLPEAQVIDGDRILHLRTVLDRVVVSDPMRDFACRMVLATHPDSVFATERVKKYLRWGASPRAAQALIRSARVRALSAGRAHVSFDDIRWFAPEVLQHRALLNYDGQAENISIRDVVDECINKLPTEAGA